MSDIIYELIFLFILLIANGLFSMSEMAIISSRKTRLHKMASDGEKGAKHALDLANNPSNFLSTVQVGITLVGILAGAFGGASIAEDLSVVLKKNNTIAPYADNISFGLVVLFITYLSLVIGELIPKRLALHNPEKTASLLAGMMQKLSKVTSPIVKLLEVSTNLMLRVLNLRESSNPPVTEDEIKILMEQGMSAGVFHETEHDLIKRTFELGDRNVGELMVPRPDIVFLDIEDSIEVIKNKIIERRLSRYPVIQGSPDNVIGIVRAKDLLAQEIAANPFDLQSVFTPPLYFPDTLSVFKAIEMFKTHRRHLALVIDEHGGIEGLVTVNDILDALVGEIPSLDEQWEQPIVQRDDGSFLLDGGVSIDEFKQALNIKSLPGEDSGHYQTLGGLLMAELRKVPSITDYIEISGWRLEVVDMDRMRVDKVLAVRK